MSKSRSIARATVVVAVAAFLVGAGVGAPAAWAQPSNVEVTEAQRRFARATELYEENNLPQALAEFRKAYSLAPNYRVLYNIGQICYLMQDNPCAYSAFSSYLEQGQSEIPDRRRQEVQRDLARLQVRVAKLRISADRPGAEVTVDDVVVGVTPLTEPVLVAAGRPRVRVTLEGYAPATRMVEVAGMETVRVDLHLVPTGSGPAPRPEAPPAASAQVDPATRAPVPDVAVRAPAPPPEQPEIASGALSAVGVSLGVLGLAGLAAGGFSSLKIMSLQREIENGDLGQFDGAKLASQQRAADRYQTFQWIGYGAGGGALAVAMALLLMDRGPSDRAAASPRLVGLLGPGGAPQLGVVGRF
jgi:hypothetical protein